MTERSRFWNGLVTGDASEAPYDAPSEFAEVLESVSRTASPTNRGGVFASELNELAVTGSVSPLSVNTGRAINTGNWYEADVAVSVVVPTPGASTRIDRIVVRKDWATQTVRVTRVAGVEGGGAPALVQVYGTTWDIPLAQASITTGGAITLTDQRELIGASINVQRFTVTGTWTRPANYTTSSRTFARNKGAGGGGGAGSRNSGAGTPGGGGGGGGAFSEAWWRTSDLGATETVTIGAGGTGPAGRGTDGVGTNGGTGGNTTFGTHLTAYGGGGGQGGQTGSAASGAGTGGGTGSAGAIVGAGGAGGNPNIVGATNGDRLAGAGAGLAAVGDVGANAEYGGASGGGSNNAGTRAGGSALFGGAAGGSGGHATGLLAGGAGGASRSYAAGGGGAGGAGGGTNNGVAGTNGTNFHDGTAGGGGGSHGTGTAGSGGAGGTYGHGGGGGGGAGGGSPGTSGAGGVGGAGLCEVITFI